MANLVVLVCFAVIITKIDALQFNEGDVEVECISLKKAITDSITSAGITFFADHPRDGQVFDPNSVEPFTPSVLIEKFYGHEASAVQFTEAITTIAYAAEEVPEKRKDRDDMRRNLYSYIKAGSYDYARRKAGALLRNIAEEFVVDSPQWKLRSCIFEDKIYDVLEALEVEHYRILNEVGDVKFGHFLSLGIGSTLAFVIDDTGSMGGEIEAAKRRAREITDFSRGTLDAPQDFVLVPFNDPGVGPVTVTNEAAKYHEALARLRAHGGGDSPELAMRGIQLAVENSRPGSIIYVITDAEAKDARLQDTVVAQARQKSIVVTFLLTNSLPGCVKRSTDGNRQCIELYRYIASATGGKVLIINKGGVFRATSVVQSSTKQGIVNLKTVVFEGNRKRPHHLVHFHVDNTIQELLLEGQGGCANIYASLPKQSKHMKLSGKRYGDIWSSDIELASINETWVGQWKLGVDVESSSCEISIRAKTTMGYVFTLFSKNQDDSSNTFQILQGNPSADSTLGVTLDGYGFGENELGEARTAELKCVSKNGSVLHSADLKSTKPDELRHVFESSVTKLDPFYIMIEGLDRSGNHYQRMHASLITPSNIRIDCDLSNLTIVAGSTVRTNITIVNNGLKDQFVVTTSDEFGASSLLSSGGSGRWTIPSQGKLVRTLTLSAASELRDGTAVQVTIVARGKLKESFQHAKCTFVVGQKKRPRIDSFSVKTVINARFAETVVTSEVTNNAAVGREAEFDMLLPKAAFITAIRVELQNETIHGVIEEKKKAKKIYDKAKERGTVAGHVAARDSSTRSYRTSMFVEAGQKVRFVLTYQQFLIRARGRYEYAVILKPDQPIRSLTVDVHISEEKPLSFVRVAPLKTTSANLVDDVPPGSSVTFGRHNYESHVRYHPDLAEQTKWSPKGIAGTFSIEYDVQRDEMYGDIAWNNGYFAHFFAPPNLPPLPKMVVTVVDISGSMYGYKIKQVVDALTSIIQSLHENDKFNVIFFGDDATSPMNNSMLEANKENIIKAVADIKQIKAFGGTNMSGAFDVLFQTFNPYMPELEIKEETSGSGSGSGPDKELSGEEPIDNAEGDVTTTLELSKRDTGLDLEYAKMAVFLTDGRPSAGETDTKKIRKSVKSMNQDRIAIHTVGLGSLVDYGFLEKLAHENGGTSRRIFEEIDADLQIRNFFEEISNPVLNDVTFEYPAEKTDDLTETTFSVFLGGSELVVAGRVKPHDEFDATEDFVDELDIMPVKASEMIPGQIRGKKFNDETEILDFDIDLKKTSKIDDSRRKIQNYTEKLWAFLTLQKTLLDASIEDNKTVKEELNARALNMSLEYGLVTPLTSLVVIRPKEKEAIESELNEAAASTTSTSAPITTTTTAPAVAAFDGDVEYSEYEDLHEPISDHALSLEFEPRGGPLLRKYPVRRPTSARLHFFGSRSRTASPGRSGTGFVGDPHFVIPVKPEFKICFNFDGLTGEIYNFVVDPLRQIIVNGILINSPAPPGAKRVKRTYVSTLGIVAHRLRKKILVTPSQITIMEPGSANLTLPTVERFTVTKHDYALQVIPISTRISIVKIGIEGLNFNVTLNRRRRAVYSRDHLDFSLFSDLRSLSSGSDGVLGQFRDLISRHEHAGKNMLRNVTVAEDGIRRAQIHARGKNLPVVERSMPIPGSHEHESTTCWYLHKNGVEAMKRPKSSFKIHTLFDTPKFYLG